MGTQLPSPQKEDRAPNFWAHVYCGQAAGMIKMPLGTEMGIGLGHVLLDGDPAPLPTKWGQSPPPQFSVHVYCGQTAEWIKMPLGTEVGLGPGDVVLDGDPASPANGRSSPSA